MLRHGQAGTRQRYDELSPLGREQAHKLARFWKAHGARFDRILTGPLKRQQETAQIVAEELNLPLGEAPLWREFDLDAVYREIAPQLAAVDSAFAQAHAEIEAEAADPEHPVHRAWRPADMAVVRAWVEGRFATRTESWLDFVARIKQALHTVEVESGERILLSTSATPIGITTASLFGSVLPHALPLAGALYNSSLTVLTHRSSIAGHGWHLSQFNLTAHLDQPSLLTLR